MDDVAEVATGALQGRRADGVVAFRGIPYARAARRGAPVRAARRPGPRGMASGPRWSSVPRAPQPETRPEGWAGEERTDEDCLVLNVFTPAVDTGARPVLVWFHGGGYTIGSASWPLYDGANLARRGDAVIVTVNHRLGLLGYLDLSEIGGAEEGRSGNAGTSNPTTSTPAVATREKHLAGRAHVSPPRRPGRSTPVDRHRRVADQRQ